jgi:hypothetical protein
MITRNLLAGCVVISILREQMCGQVLLLATRTIIVVVEDDPSSTNL